jgi:hypothetical protein
VIRQIATHLRDCESAKAVFGAGDLFFEWGGWPGKGALGNPSADKWNAGPPRLIQFNDWASHLNYFQEFHALTKRCFTSDTGRWIVFRS